MDNVSQIDDLSELENMELNRRMDIAFAVVPAAVKLFRERHELDGQIKDASKGLSRNWPWAVFFLALLIQYFLLDSGSSFTWTGWVALSVFVWWLLKQHEIWLMHVQRKRYNKWLIDLEVTWGGATGSTTFSEISNFVDEGYFDNRSDTFRDWWSEQTTIILYRVCGVERGERIGEERAGRSREFRQKLQDLHQKQGGDDE